MSSKLKAVADPRLRAERALIRRLGSDELACYRDQPFAVAAGHDDLSRIFEPADGIDDLLLGRFDVADPDGAQVLDFFLQHRAARCDRFPRIFVLSSSDEPLRASAHCEFSTSLSSD